MEGLAFHLAGSYVVPMQPTRLPKKKDVALALLEQASVFVHLDPRLDQVFVPPWFRNKPQLVLQIGLNMAIPIPDLAVDDAGLSCTLSFNRSPHHCRIPWNAVFALVGDNGRGMVWPDDVPPEVAAEAEKQAKAAQAKAKIAAVQAGPAEAKQPAVAAKRGADAESETQAAVAKPARRKKVASGASGSKAAASTTKRDAKDAKKTRAQRKRKAEAPAAPVPAAARVPAAAPEPARSATAGAPGAPAKRKRELPPYLRVVK